jgi:sialic acid synthase SpsE
MRDLVRQVREAEVLLGTFDKQLQEVEVGVVEVLRRSIVAKHDLPSGHTLQMSDLAWTRPGDGLQAGQEHQVLGKTLAVNLKQGQRISVTDFA